MIDSSLQMEFVPVVNWKMLPLSFLVVAFAAVAFNVLSQDSDMEFVAFGAAYSNAQNPEIIANKKPANNALPSVKVDLSQNNKSATIPTISKLEVQTSTAEASKEAIPISNAESLEPQPALKQSSDGGQKNDLNNTDQLVAMVNDMTIGQRINEAGIAADLADDDLSNINGSGEFQADTQESPDDKIEPVVPSPEEEFLQSLIGMTISSNNNLVYKAREKLNDGLYGIQSRKMQDAVDRGSVSLVSYLIEQGESVNASNTQGETALLKAAWNGDEQMVRNLLDLGAEILRASDDGRTPLFSATVSGNFAVVRLLLEQGAPSNVKTATGKTPLMISAASNYPDITRLLLLYGGDPDVIDYNGRNALFYALWDRNMDVVKYLLDAGAKLVLTDSLGQTAIDIARLRKIDLPSLAAERTEKN